jgi:hypothetical protein
MVNTKQTLGTRLRVLSLSSSIGKIHKNLIQYVQNNNKYFFIIIQAAEHWGDLAKLNPTQSLPQQVLHTRGEDQQGREGFFQFFHNSS